MLDVDQAKKGLERLFDSSNLSKINITGGEPLLHMKPLEELLKFCKEDIQIPYISIVTNGSLLNERRLEKIGDYLNCVGVSIDSFNDETNRLIGRKSIDAKRISEILDDRDIAFKVNTVVSAFNKEENFHNQMQELKPMRWKCFQAITVPGENDGIDVPNFQVCDEDFFGFINRHSEFNPVVETEEIMENSYLILDEQMNFLRSKSMNCNLLDESITVEEMLSDIRFSYDDYIKRDGEFFVSNSE